MFEWDGMQLTEDEILVALDLYFFSGQNEFPQDIQVLFAHYSTDPLGSGDGTWIVIFLREGQLYKNGAFHYADDYDYFLWYEPEKTTVATLREYTFDWITHGGAFEQAPRLKNRLNQVLDELEERG